MSEIWNFNTRTLTTPFPEIPTPPTAVQIRQEMDTNSSKLISISGMQTTIQESIDNIAIGTASINSPAIEFTLTSGSVTSGTYENTKNLDHVYHIIRDSALSFDVSYKFDIDLDSIPTELVVTGRVEDKHEILNVDMWNYHNSQWEFVGTISGSLTDNTYRFVLFQSFVGNTAGLIGDVQVRFYSTALSDIILNIDQMYVSYSKLERQQGYSGHATSASATTISLGVDASSVNNYYTPCLVYVNHGTGEKQYAKAISYIGASKTLQLELPMAVVLDTTSHITLSAWAQMSTDNVAIADAVRTELAPELNHVLTLENQTSALTPTQATMILEMYELLGISPYKPLVVSKTGTYTGSRVAGTIQQNISGNDNQTIVTRV